MRVSGPTRVRRMGSVSTRTPSISMRTVAWPRKVTRGSARVASQRKYHRTDAARHRRYHRHMVTNDTIRSAPKVLLHDHLDGGLRPATVIELAQETGYQDLPTEDPASWAGGSAPAPTAARWSCTWRASPTRSGVMQTPEAIARVASECAQDLAADGIVYAEVRYAPELSTQGGLSLDEVMEAWLDGFETGARRCRRGRQPHRHPGHRHGHAPVRPVGRDRRARRSAIATRAPSASTSPAPRTASRRAGTSTPSSSSIARTSTSPSMPARPSACPRSGRRCSGAAPSGWATACASSTTSRSAPRATSRSAGWRSSCATTACPWRCARPRTSHTGAVESIEKHPIDLLRRLRYRVTVNTDNRLMSGVSLSDEFAALDRRPSTSASTRCSGSRRTR